MSSPTAERQAGLGAALLDVERPDWSLTLDLARLRVSSVWDCPLAQLYHTEFEAVSNPYLSPYSNALSLLTEGRADPDRTEFAVSHGFAFEGSSNLTPGEHDEYRYGSALTTAWKREANRRRSALNAFLSSPYLSLDADTPDHPLTLAMCAALRGAALLDATWVPTPGHEPQGYVSGVPALWDGLVDIDGTDMASTSACVLSQIYAHLGAPPLAWLDQVDMLPPDPGGYAKGLHALFGHLPPGEVEDAAYRYGFDSSADRCIATSNWAIGKIPGGACGHSMLNTAWTTLLRARRSTSREVNGVQVHMFGSIAAAHKRLFPAPDDEPFGYLPEAETDTPKPPRSWLGNLFGR